MSVPAAGSATLPALSLHHGVACLVWHSAAAAVSSSSVSRLYISGAQQSVLLLLLLHR